MLWTFDQWMHLLAVLAWPAVALIAGVAWVHGCRLLFDAMDNWKIYVGDAVCDATKDLCETFMAVARQVGPVPATKREMIETTCERALLAVLAARGGFPARQNEAPGRSLVREVREMYQELEQPTPRPEPVAGNHAPGMTDLMVSPESLDEYLVDDLYAQFTATEEDAADYVETETADLADLEDL